MSPTLVVGGACQLFFFLFFLFFILSFRFISKGGAGGWRGAVEGGGKGGSDFFFPFFSFQSCLRGGTIVKSFSFLRTCILGGMCSA